MSQNSFYGGKQGRTYNIVAHFDTVADMVTQFQKGGSFNTVNFNEYVIIDTIINENQRHSYENGLLYRRGMNYSENFDPNKILQEGYTTLTSYDWDKSNTMTLRGVVNSIYDDEHIPAAGSDPQLIEVTGVTVPKYRHFEYRILDTSGTTASVEIFFTDLILDVNTQGESYYRFNKDWQSFISNPGGGAEYVGQIVGPQGDSPELEMENWDQFIEDYQDQDVKKGSKGHLYASRQPGIEEDNTEPAAGSFYNNIQFGYYNILDEQDNISGACISFDMPYTVFKYNAHSGSAYGPTIINTTQAVIDADQEPADISAYYKVDDKYYLWDTTRVILHDESSDPYPYEYETDPGFVEATPWTVAITQGADQKYHYDYQGLIRERAKSHDAIFYKDYDITVPKGIHGVDTDITIDENYEVVRTVTDYSTSESGTETSSHIRGLKIIDSVTADMDQGRKSMLYINYHQNMDISGRESIAFPAFSRVGVTNQYRLDLSKYYQYHYTYGTTEYSSTLSSPYPVNEVVDVKVVNNKICALYSDPTYRQNYNTQHPNECLTDTFNDNRWTYTTDDLGNSRTTDGIFYWIIVGSIEGKNVYYKKFNNVADLKAAYPYGFGKDQQGQTIENEKGMMGALATIDTGTEIQSWFYDYNMPYTAAENWTMLSTVVIGVITSPLNVIISSTAGANGKPSDTTLDSSLQANGIWLKIESK